ncbi:MAG: HPr(Ser) kinase/phosphatase [Gemmatimonadota bacterium]|nr:MAG: HPr(Ser) kinase/phosphatase [Gemmatimonadota bacterium]
MSFKVQELLEIRGESLRLRLVTGGEQALAREVKRAEISSPGLALAGYTERFVGGRIQVLGETDVSYLNSLDEARRRESVETLLSFDIACIIATKGQDLPPVLLEVAERLGTPVVVSELKTAEFYRRMIPFMNDRFAPRTYLHGSLADVYGVGLLFVGRSGIGKSECVLDLVERGHRLVADDVVQISRQGHDVLIGRGHELSRHHMEIRGVGIVDVRALFGIRATRQQKRLEVVVQLVEWRQQEADVRTRLHTDHADILDVPIRRVTIPLTPGKNITVINEVDAMDHLLRYAGVHAAAAFNDGLKDVMAPVREYLEEDYE